MKTFHNILSAFNIIVCIIYLIRVGYSIYPVIIIVLEIIALIVTLIIDGKISKKSWMIKKQ